MIVHLFKNLSVRSDWEAFAEDGRPMGSFKKLAEFRGKYNHPLHLGIHKTRCPKVIKDKRLWSYGKFYYADIKETANPKKTAAYRAFRRLIKKYDPTGKLIEKAPDILRQLIVDEWPTTPYTANDLEDLWYSYIKDNSGK